MAEYTGNMPLQSRFEELQLTAEQVLKRESGHKRASAELALHIVAQIVWTA